MLNASRETFGAGSVEGSGGMPVAGALIISNSDLLDRYFSYLNRNDWSEMSAFMQIIMDTGAIDNYLQDGNL